MHVAMIIDDERLEQEQSMLARLCIGLLAEGMLVTRIVSDRPKPESIGISEQRLALAPRISTTMHVLPWMRRPRTLRVMEQLDRSIPDVLYAVGEGAWGLGIDLGIEIERPVVIDVSSTAQVETAPKPDRAPPVAGYVASSHALARMLGERVEKELVSAVPIGVSIPPQPRKCEIDPDRPLALGIIGKARDVRAYAVLLEAIALTTQRGIELEVILELSGPREHEIWKHAERLDIIRCVSAIGEASLYRTLMTRCDALLLPERTGQPRSIMLEAMVLGIPVIALADPAVDMLVNGETADLVGSMRKDDWAGLLARLVDDPEHSRAIGQGARSFISAHHKSSDQVNRLIHVLDRASTGGTMRFQAAKP